MRILMVLELEFPPDTRVRNEMMSLSEAGHEVHLACSTRKNKPDFEVSDGITIHRRPMSKFIYKSSVGSLVFPFYFNFWRKFLEKLVLENKYDVIHIHDLPLSRVGYELKVRFNIPLIIDLHENWPELLRISPHTKTIPGRLFCNIRQWESYERKYIRYADKIIVVIEEARERIINLSVPEQKICVVSNTLNIKDFVTTPDYEKNNSGKIIFIYEGGITYHRGLQYILKALSKIKSLPHKFEFWIVGSGSYLNRLRLLSRQLNLDDHIRFLGWQPLEKVHDLLNMADVAVIPHIKSPHTDSTIPHKLFHYMYTGLPVLASDCDPIKRILKETSCGYTYTYDNTDELVSILEMILSGKISLNRTEGKEWIIRKYNWTNEEIKLQKIYKELKSN